MKQLYAVSHALPCPHAQNEIISFIEAIFAVPDDRTGCVVEAGCFQGGSTAKFSMAASTVGRQLVVFDSFEGLPDHDEPLDKGVFDWHVSPPGGFSVTEEEVKRNIARFGDVEVCEFIKGWFEDTIPRFFRPVVAVYLDVDLASSTRTCLKYLYPLLVGGGTLYSHDGYSPPVCEVFDDDRFWEEEIGCQKPPIEGIGKRKLLKIVKPSEFEKE